MRRIVGRDNGPTIGERKEASVVEVVIGGIDGERNRVGSTCSEVEGFWCYSVAWPLLSPKLLVLLVPTPYKGSVSGRSGRTGRERSRRESVVAVNVQVLMRGSGEITWWDEIQCQWL